MREPKVAVQAKRPGGEKAVVTYVGDGDGASLKRKNGSVLNCRIDTIDAPETAKPKYGKAGQPYAEEAKKTLQRMILNKEVTVIVTNPNGKYNRQYCKIEVEGVGVDKAMLQAGAAWLYRRYSNDPELSKTEEGAKKAKRGLWADPNAQSPEDFRRGN